MHIAILAPSDRSFISEFLPNHPIENLPKGYNGAPFIGTIIAELLKRKDCKVSAITTTVSTDNDYAVRTFSHENFTWIVVPERPRAFGMNGRKLGRLMDFYAYERQEMARAVKAIKPDLVHAHWSYEFAGAALESGYPYLVTVHDNAWQVMRFTKDTYRLARLLMSEHVLRQVHFASTVSPYMLPYAASKCRSVRVIPNPVAIEYTFADVEPLILARCRTLSSPRLIMINNGWNDRKNGDAGLAAFKHLQVTLPGATLHLFGSGSEAGGPAEKAGVRLGVKNVFYHGTVTHELLFEELKKAHLLLHPALEESFGVALIEAMSCGVPSVGGVDSGAVPWVIHDRRLLVDVTKPKEIEDKLVELLTDPDLYQQIAKDGYNNVASRFASAAVVDIYVDYYRQIMAEWQTN